MFHPNNSLNAVSITLELKIVAHKGLYKQEKIGEVCLVDCLYMTVVNCLFSIFLDWVYTNSHWNCAIICKLGTFILGSKMCYCLERHWNFTQYSLFKFKLKSLFISIYLDQNWFTKIKIKNIWLSFKKACQLAVYSCVGNAVDRITLLRHRLLW